jgi:hypothetical protein
MASPLERSGGSGEVTGHGLLSDSTRSRSEPIFRVSGGYQRSSSPLCPRRRASVQARSLRGSSRSFAGSLRARMTVEGQCGQAPVRVMPAKAGIRPGIWRGQDPGLRRDDGAEGRRENLHVSSSALCRGSMAQQSPRSESLLDGSSGRAR